jgi:hypothetical protein
VVKGTQVQVGPVEVEVGATRLLGLDGLTVVRVQLDADGGRTVHAKTREGFPPGCPECGVISTSFKGSADRVHRVLGELARSFIGDASSVLVQHDLVVEVDVTA